MDKSSSRPIRTWRRNGIPGAFYSGLPTQLHRRMVCKGGEEVDGLRIRRRPNSAGASGDLRDTWKSTTQTFADAAGLEVDGYDPAAAFLTAKGVAACRAVDAQQPTPIIGSNTGAGPDTLAEIFAGEEGFTVLDGIRAAMGGLTRAEAGNGACQRASYIDGKWMKALRAGCTQFVILASGLDSRAWRLPGMKKFVKVFEVDVPEAHQYKAQCLGALSEPPDMTCTRVVVEADLTQPNEWTTALLGAGFDPTEPSFFVAEGLLMYLPPDVVPGLLKAVGACRVPVLPAAAAAAPSPAAAPTAAAAAPAAEYAYAGRAILVHIGVAVFASPQHR